MTTTQQEREAAFVAWRRRTAKINPDDAVALDGFTEGYANRGTRSMHIGFKAGWEAARATLPQRDEPVAEGKAALNPWFCQGCGLNNSFLRRDAFGQNKCPSCLTTPPSPSMREVLVDMVAHLAGAASAYRTYAKRHASLGKVPADPFFTTRLSDFDKAVERGRAELARQEGSK